MMHRHPDPVHAAEACAKYILMRLEGAMSSGAQATLAISGGSSPRLMFEVFAKTRFPWERVQLFWVDERHVPPTDPQSNFKLTNEAWLAPGGFPASNIHTVDTSLPPEESARCYAEQIRSFLPLDVVHLGLGPDCHTASLFPGEPLINNRKDLAAAVWVEKMKQWRVTLLPGVLLAARHRVMLIAGSDKAEALRAALYGNPDPQRYPAQLVARDADLFLDEAAALFATNSHE
jgi:6-phosphogluconolactonase